MPRAVRTPLLLVAAALLATCAAPHPRPGGSDEVVRPPCDPLQSPRRLELFNRESRTSIIRNGPNEDSIHYTPREGGRERELFLCSYHYHCDIEHKQECNADVPSGREHCDELPAADDWVEIHVVYAADVDHSGDCPAESLKCCLGPPFVARGYHAQVTAGGNPDDPLPAPWDPPFAEYTGSNTGWDEPGKCKDLKVEWSFALGCDQRVSQAQIRKHFDHPDGARVLQGGVRVSPDLWRVQP